MWWRLGSAGGEAVALADGGAHRLGIPMAALIADWDAALERLAALPAEAPPFAGRLEAPYLPGAIYGAGANYVDHVIEMIGRPPTPKATSQPFFFLKPPAASIVGPDATVALPHENAQLDWEAEIAVIIGRDARHVSEAAAMDHVAGYAIVNDLSARDLMKRDDVPFVYDWVGQKCFPGALPIGPWITLAAAVPDPHALAIRLWVDDQLMQDSNSAQMHWSIPEQIAWLSRRVGLRAGDLICTGTPAGVGHKRGRYLRAGETVRIAIDGLGELVTHIGPVER